MKLGHLESESGQFGVGDLESDRVEAPIQFGADCQSGLRGGMRNQIDDHLVTDQGTPPPILGHVGDHAMLDVVPRAGPRWKVANMDGHPQAYSQLLQGRLPPAAPAAGAATPVGRDQQVLCPWVSFGTHLLPPSADGLPRELRRIVIDAHAHPALVLAQLDHPRGNAFAQMRVREVVHGHLFGCARGVPLAPPVLERADEFLLLGVRGDHRLTASLKPLDHCVEVLNLRMAIRMRGAFLGLAVALQAIASLPQHHAHRPRADGMRLPRQFLRQAGGALAGSTQSRLRSPSTHRLHQDFQRLQQPRIRLGQALAPASLPAHTHRQNSLGLLLAHR